MHSSDLRVGLIGFGFAGQTFHAPVLSAVPGLQLAAVASSQADKVKAQWPQALVLPDAQTLLARPDIDLVVIATPNDLHFPQACSALMAGKHVVVDKPFTLNATQARELATLAQQHGRLISVYQNRRLILIF